MAERAKTTIGFVSWVDSVEQFFLLARTQTLQPRSGASMKRNLDQDTKRSPANPIELDVEETIRRRAYVLHEERGRGDGHELEDWIEMEAEVLRSKDIAKAACPG
jgi:hypothetical protein